MTTVAVTDYASLSTAIGDFEERTFDSGDLDRIIGLAESVIRLYLPPHFAKEAASVLTLVSGSVTLPAGFIRAIGLTHLTYGALTQNTMGAVRERRVWDTGGIPKIFAVTASTIEVAASYSGALTLDYEGTLAGLTSLNTTNWLVTNAPHVYLSACLAIAKFKEQDMTSFAGIQAVVGRTLDDLGFQSIVAQLGRAAIRIPGATP